MLLRKAKTPSPKTSPTKKKEGKPSPTTSPTSAPKDPPKQDPKDDPPKETAASNIPHGLRELVLTADQKQRRASLEGRSVQDLKETIISMGDRIRELEQEVIALRMQRFNPTPKAAPFSPSSAWGDCVMSQGTLTPDLSPHMPPTPNMFKPSKPTPQTEYKLSSQVLLVGSDGIRPTTLLQLLVDAHGRVDRRGADTPRVGPIKSAWDREPPPDTEEDLNLVLPEKARTTKSAESDEVKVTSPADHPQRRTPPPPLDSSAVGRAAIDLAETCFSPIHPITPGQLDRIMTANSLEALRSDKVLIHPIPPTARAAMDYIQKAYDKEADCFSHDLDRLRKIVTHLCQELTGIMESEPVFQHVRSPCYVFGDIHGNFRDLLYFLDHIISFQDLHYTPSNVLFLGDYVDRGPHGLECVVLLLALKLSCPNQVTMLRGNHEDPLVNGDVRHYGSAAFQSQCITLFGRDDGIEVWRIINEKIFRMLPLAATIDEKIFCVHGGLPRYNGGFDDRLQMLQSPDFPKLEYFSVFDDCEDEDLKPWVQMACDLCWSDPREQEEVGGYYGMNDFGFAPNSRGSGTLAFGSKAVETFLKNHGYQYIFRAHQEKSDGLRLSKSARVVTIFSSSDYEGHRNGAGVLFVNHKAEIRMIIKQTEY